VLDRDIRAVELMAHVSSLPPPAPLEINDRNIAEKWRKWKSSLDFYAKATKVDQ